MTSTSLITPSRVVVLMLVLFGCDGSHQSRSSASSAVPGVSAKPSQPPAAGTSGTDRDDPLPPLAYESALPEALREMVGRPFTGDLDEMVEQAVRRDAGVVSRSTAPITS